MPQLRSGVRRGRRPASAAPRPDQKKGKTRNNKATGRSAGKRTAENIDYNIGGCIKDKEIVVVVDGGGGDSEKGNIGAALRKTALHKVEDNNKGVKEAVEKKMDECDSGGNGSDKGLGAEDEGSTAPIPERVRYINRLVFFFLLIWCDILYLQII